MLTLVDLVALAIATGAGALPKCIAIGSGIGRWSGCFALALASSSVRMPLIYLALTCVVVFVAGLLVRVTQGDVPNGGILGTVIALIGLGIQIGLLVVAVAIASVVAANTPSPPAPPCLRFCGNSTLSGEVVGLFVAVAILIAGLIVVAHLLAGFVCGALGSWCGRLFTRRGRP